MVKVGKYNTTLAKNHMRGKRISLYVLCNRVERSIQEYESVVAAKAAVIPNITTFQATYCQTTTNMFFCSATYLAVVADLEGNCRIGSGGFIEEKFYNRYKQQK